MVRLLFLKIYTIYYSIQQYNIYFTDNIQSVCQVRLHIMFPVALSRGHMEEFMLSSTTQQINKPRPGQHLLPLRWTHPKSPYARVDRSLTQTHTAYQHSPSAGVSGCTLEEQTCDPEFLLPWSRFPIPTFFLLSRCLFPLLLWLSVHDGQIRGCNPSATHHMARPCCHRCSDWTSMPLWCCHVVRNQSATDDGRSAHC